MHHPPFPFGNTIETENLLLATSDVQILQTAIQGDGPLSELLRVHVAENWNPFGITALEYALRKLIDEPEAKHWWTWLTFIPKDNILVGSGGYKGVPDLAGMVEIGYAVAPNYQHQGIGKEMAAGLVKHAFSHPEVHFVQAHTLNEENPSTRILTALGFQNMGTVENETALQWILSR